MPTPYAMASYMSLCGTELVNVARLKAYVGNGVTTVRVRNLGCEGLEEILPEDSQPPVGGYQLPDLDNAPWYDPAVPESKNFAGLLVTDVTMSEPMSRTVTKNVGRGQTLGRLRLEGRTIVVTGWLIGKTCCANGYGLNWLNSVLSGECIGNDCGGCDLDFLSCCPNISGEDSCLVTKDPVTGRTVPYIRPEGETEYQRADTFWRRMYGVGIVSGVTILDCRGSNCGNCGCGSVTQVEFTLATESAYVNSFGDDIIPTTVAPQCHDDQICDVTWVEDGTNCLDQNDCPVEPDCAEDPFCPPPPLPPAPISTIDVTCGCLPLSSIRVNSSVQASREWGSSTLDFTVFAGSMPLRNLAVRVWQQNSSGPISPDCGSTEAFPDCDAKATLLISYVPAGGTLVFSGSHRTVNVTCNGKTKSAIRSITSATDGPFDWPDLNCTGVCVSVTFDCSFTAEDASVQVTRINRDL